jgi:hypothetical protein
VKIFLTFIVFKNSPLASKYQRNIADLEAAVNVIIRWWRPFYARLVEIRKERTVKKAVVS